MSESEALSLGNELWQYAMNAIWGNDEVWKRHFSEESNQFICDTTVQEVREKFTQDSKVEVCLANDCKTDSLDDYIQLTANCNSLGRGANQFYKETILSIKSIQENEIVFTATSSYCNRSFCPVESNIANTIEKDFIIKKVDNNWLINYFYLPN